MTGPRCSLTMQNVNFTLTKSLTRTDVHHGKAAEILSAPNSLKWPPLQGGAGSQEEGGGEPKFGGYVMCSVLVLLRAVIIGSTLPPISRPHAMLAGWLAG